MLQNIFELQGGVSKNFNIRVMQSFMTRRTIFFILKRIFKKNSKNRKKGFSE